MHTCHARRRSREGREGKGFVKAIFNIVVTVAWAAHMVPGWCCHSACKAENPPQHESPAVSCRCYGGGSVTLTACHESAAPSGSRELAEEGDGISMPTEDHGCGLCECEATLGGSAHECLRVLVCERRAPLADLLRESGGAPDPSSERRRATGFREAQPPFALFERLLI